VVRNERLPVLIPGAFDCFSYRFARIGHPRTPRFLLSRWKSTDPYHAMARASSPLFKVTLR
jgi:hypothetical protein